MTANQLPAAVTITAKDVNGNNVLKQYNAVRMLTFDYVRRIVNVFDVTGSFNFSLSDVSTVTYTVNGTVTTVVMS